MESSFIFPIAYMCANLCASEFSTTLQQASFGSIVLSYTKKDFECRIIATRSCVAILFFSPWVDLLEGNGRGAGWREGMRERRREGFSAMLNLDSRLCLHSWLVFQSFSSNALVFLQFHVVMVLCTYILQ